MHAPLDGGHQRSHIAHHILCHGRIFYCLGSVCQIHGDVIKWKQFLCYWPFVRGIHRAPVNSPHKGQWRGALIFSLICLWIKGWVNNREAVDLRRHRAHYDVSVMLPDTQEIYSSVMNVYRNQNNIFSVGDFLNYFLKHYNTVFLLSYFRYTGFVMHVISS